MVAQSKCSYDEVPYESRAFQQTHPDHLATLGRLFGLSPAPVTRCRVLELGCASGGNLIPMAFHLPNSEFIGVDLSGRQVEMGRQVIRDLDLKNIRIEHASIMDVDSSWGMFDYVICHGVYSWVPDEVREKILAVSSANLLSNGIAYVSFNTYPGWHMREMLRHMMLYHSSKFGNTTKRIEQARALLDFLVHSLPSADSPYGLLLRKELALLKACTDSYLLHEYLEDVNSPVYFHEFVERSARHNLQYLADSDFGSMLMSGFPDETAETLQKISPDIVSSEQYMDFVRNRSFRQALLCHKEHPLKRDLGPEDIEGMLITFAAGIESEPPNLLPGVKQVFRTRQGSTIETDYPLTKAAFAVLKLLWPRAIDLDSLFLEARELLDGVPLVESADWPHARQILAQDILKCYAGNAVELHTWQPDYVIEIGNAPRVSQIASYQIDRGPSVVNQRHEMVNLDPFSAQIVTLLDGTRDRAALLQCLIGLVENGTLTLQERGNPITNRLLLEKALATAAEQTLASLAGSALLVE